MESFSRKRPNFYQFRDWFMEEVNRHTQREVKNPFMSWSGVGSRELRGQIIESFMLNLEARFGFRPVCKENPATLDGSLESVVIQIYHVFSTMSLVDHINAKVYKEKKDKMH